MSTSVHSKPSLVHSIIHTCLMMIQVKKGTYVLKISCSPPQIFNVHTPFSLPSDL